MTSQVDVTPALGRRVIEDADKLREHRLADFLGKRLSFRDVPLPVPLDPMAEDLVEEHSAGAVAQNGRTYHRVPQQIQTCELRHSRGVC